ncbi:MAG: patatin family protein [Lachnospiraceae bacterium]|nr:patatin family protein [Lachnospiraceae bacterium]
MKLGMVLEGGGMRGMYTAGILDVLMENEIVVDGIVGVSAGTVFGCNYKSKQIGRTIRYNKKYCKDPRYGSMKSLLKTGDIFDKDFCYNRLPKELDPFDYKTFTENPMEFYATCTDANTGKAFYKRCYNGDDKELEWFRASASMPLVSKVVEIDGGAYLDGGIADSIPIRWMQEKGFEKNIVILTRPEGYRKSKNRLLWLMRIALHKYPNMIKAMKNRHINYNESLDEVFRLRKEGKVLLFCPDAGMDVSRTESDPDKLEEAYRMGKKHAFARLEEIRAFMKS